MALKRITMLDVFEILRRWHNNQSLTHISRTLGYDRKTVSKFIQAAKLIRKMTPQQPKPFHNRQWNFYEISLIL